MWYFRKLPWSCCRIRESWVLLNSGLWQVKWAQTPKSNEAHFVWLSLRVAENNLLSPSASKYGKWIWLSNRKRLQGSGGREGGGSPAVRPVQGSAWSVPLEVFPPQPASGQCVLPFCFTSRGTVLLHPHSLGWGRGGDASKSWPQAPKSSV